MWSLHVSGERKFVRGIWVTCPRWPPCPYMVKTLQKSSPEPKGQWPWALVCSIGALSPSKFVQMVTLGWPWPILWQGQICPFCFYMGKSVRKSFNGRNLQQMTRVTWGIFLPKNSDTALGLYTCLKIWNMCKIRLQKYFLETCNKWAKWPGFSVGNRILSSKGCLPLSRGYIHVEKH